MWLQVDGRLDKNSFLNPETGTIFTRPFGGYPYGIFNFGNVSEVYVEENTNLINWMKEQGIPKAEEI